MSNDSERRTVRETPEGREEIRERPVPRSGVAGWWVAAVVAVAAVVGLIFLFANQNRQDELQAAREQGAAQASLSAATADAQHAAAQADQAAQNALDSTARTSRRAAEAAQSAADQTAQAAQSAGEAGQNAAASEPAPAQQP